MGLLGRVANLGKGLWKVATSDRSPGERERALDEELARDASRPLPPRPSTGSTGAPSTGSTGAPSAGSPPPASPDPDRPVKRRL
jgi:hypothetical protein